MHHVLFVRACSGNPSLQDLATTVSSALSLGEMELRESSNHEGGDYLRGYASNASVKVCRTDRSVLDNFPFCVVLEGPRNGRGITAITTAPESIAARLAGAGLHVVVPSAGWSKQDWTPSGLQFGGHCEL